MTNRRTGFSAAEVMVAVLVAGVLAIPTLGLMFQSRDAEQRSRYEYLAVLAARDEMYQSRVLAALGRTPDQIRHGFNPLTGSILETLFASPPPAIAFHADQERVEVALEFEAANPAAKRLRVGKLRARWMSEAVTSGPNAKSRRTSMDLVFGVVLPHKP
jgi:hypothetical protein